MLRKESRKERKDGQTAVEYMLLLAVVVAIVLMAFRTYLPRIYSSSGIYFNRVVVGIIGPTGRCGDGPPEDFRFETCESCPPDSAIECGCLDSFCDTAERCSTCTPNCPLGDAYLCVSDCCGMPACADSPKCD